jgi:DNA replication protein DnaC
MMLSDDLHEATLQDESTLWRPSPEDAVKLRQSNGWQTWNDIKYDHLNDTERATLETAVSSAKKYVTEYQDRPGVGMILVAGKVDGDMDRTGYGCGKTTIAKIIHSHISVTSYAAGIPGSLSIRPTGRFYEARALMALFDKDNFDQRYTFSQFGNLLVIDDVGREGTLKWEKRDPELQLQEKQDRYYSIINHCYTSGVGVVVTSNLTSRELATFLGGASWSRLLQIVPKRYRVNMTGIRDMRPLIAETDWF